MSDTRPAPARGRPPTITRERIADAGREIGLPALTIVGMAARLGISHMGLYRHVSGLDELRQLVAEEMFLRWQFPPPELAATMPLGPYMTAFAESIWSLVAAHPGIAPYLLRGDMITKAMIEKIVTHQEELSRICGITFAQSRWLMLTVAFHAVAIADTVLPRRPHPQEVTAAPGAGSVIDPEHESGIRALIKGALALLPEITVFPYPVAETARHDPGYRPLGDDPALGWTTGPGDRT